MAALPLIRGFGDEAVFGYRGGRAIRASEFLHDVSRLARRLPDRGQVLNLCTDRYLFAVGFAAALVRGQTSLFPPNLTPDTMARLANRYPGAYCLTEDGACPAVMERLVFPELRAEASGAAPVPLIPASQVAAIVFTSGSTGEPVPHPKRWGSLVTGAGTEKGRVGSGLAPGTAVLGTVPPQHMYGLELTVMLAMQCGLALHAGRPFFSADVRDALASLPRPRILVTTPLHLRVMLDEADETPAADLLVCATAPLSPQLAATAEERFGAPLYEIYGCTEAGQIAARRTVDAAEWRAMPGVALRTDGAGTWVRGAHIDGEILLGDVIDLRGRDRFVLHGRTADLVNVAGKRTSLEYLNYHLNSIAGVRDGAFVAPATDEKGVPRLMAFVVAPDLAREDVMNALRQRVDAAFLPRPLVLVDALPRNATGKLPRKALEELVDGIASEAG
jgi:acyl-coenzyme A synthetase/AMP-(fatty) acid ligase